MRLASKKFFVRRETFLFFIYFSLYQRYVDFVV